MNNSILTVSSIAIMALSVLLSSCASSVPPNAAEDIPVRPERSSVKLDKHSTSSIAQITNKDQEEAAYQIVRSQTDEPLTVRQLQNYVDRCGPQSSGVQPTKIDCSELGLRIKKVYKTEDQVVDALITLDRLGRNASAEDVSDDLRDGRADNSLNAQAIASGIFEPAPPAPEAPPPEEVEDIITNGLVDAIIANTQGR